MERVLRHLFSVRTSIHISSLQRTQQSPRLLWKSSQRASAPLVTARFSSKAHPEPVDDKPIPYARSNAHAYKATENWRDYVTEEEMPYANSTSFIVKSSIAIFLIYFCVLRESNDIDIMLDRDLFEIMPDLEIPILESEIKRLEACGVSTEELKKKVEELKKLAAEKSDG